MRRDFFISYNSVDRHWAEWIAWQLEEAGYATIIQSWDIPPGTDLVLEISRASVEAERIIAVMTASYIQTESTKPEWFAKLLADPSGVRNFILPIRVEHCDIPSVFKPLVYIDLVGLNEIDAKGSLLNGIKFTRGKPRIAPQFPGKQAANSLLQQATISSPYAREFEKEEYDVFLCYNNDDKEVIKAICRDLKDAGIIPWLDEWEIQPGTYWQEALEKQVNNIRSAGVFVGSKGIGPWQNLEIKAFLQQFISRGRPVIPIFLQNCGNNVVLPPFLSMLHYVDFREDNPDPMEQLIWGITGKRPPFK
jgi:hypothetical protein